MIAISLKLPDEIIRESEELAEKIGISRSELIRQALQHELEHIKAGLQQAEMAKALEAMRSDEAYLADSEALTQGLGIELADEDSPVWWQKSY